MGAAAACPSGAIEERPDADPGGRVTQINRYGLRRRHRRRSRTQELPLAANPRGRSNFLIDTYLNVAQIKKYEYPGKSFRLELDQVGSI